MKEFIKRILLIAILLFPTAIFAAGSTKCEISGSSSTTSSTASANVGSNVTIYVRVTGLNGNKVVSAGGDIEYDSSYLEYVSASNLSGWSNNSRKMSDGLYRNNVMDNSMEDPITTDKTTYSITFKTLKTGTTQVTFKNIEVASAS